jgi:arsenate reductase-like glutaredoxin family protein
MTTYKRVKSKGFEEGIEHSVVNLFKNGISIEQIPKLLDLPLDKVRSIVEKYLKSQAYGS